MGNSKLCGKDPCLSRLNPFRSSPCFLFTYLPHTYFENTLGKGKLASDEQSFLYPQCFFFFFHFFLIFIKFKIICRQILSNCWDITEEINISNCLALISTCNQSFENARVAFVKGADKRNGFFEKNNKQYANV